MEPLSRDSLEEGLAVGISIAIIAILILQSYPPAPMNDEELLNFVLNPEEYIGSSIALEGQIATWELLSSPLVHIYFYPHLVGGGLEYWEQVRETINNHALEWIDSHGWGWFKLTADFFPIPKPIPALTQLYIHSEEHLGDGYFLKNESVIVSGILKKGPVPGMDWTFKFGLYGSSYYLAADKIWLK